MSDIRDILELDQGLASVPTKEAIVGGNKVSYALLYILDEINYFLFVQYYYGRWKIILWLMKSLRTFVFIGDNHVKFT